MFSKEAITALQESQAIAAAAVAFKDQGESLNAVTLPSDYTIHDLEKFLPERRRARGSMSTSSIAAFEAYTSGNHQHGCNVFVDQTAMAATAVLNLGTPDAPGHADDTAVLTLQRTAAYKALLLVANGAGHSQTVVAEFLEDWPDFIKCFNDAGEITPPKAIAAIRKLTIESLRKLESTEQQLSASRSAFESVQATSADPLPTTIYFTCEPYQDLPARTFVLRLSIKTGESKPAISLRIVKAEKHAEEMALELSDLITAAFGGTEEIPVLLGKYSRFN